MRNPCAKFLALCAGLLLTLTLRAGSYSSITNNVTGSDQTVCSGTTPTALTGGLPGGGTGTFTYQWQTSTTSSTTGFSNISGATTQNYAPGSATATRWYRRIVASGAELDTSNATNIVVTPVLSANTIASAQTICYNTAPAQLVGSSPAGGTGTYAYQWQSSPDNTTFTPIAGATGLNLQPPVITANTWYQRIVTSGGCTSTSTSVKMTVTPLIANDSVTANQSLCSGQTPLALTGSNATGGNGSYSYLWQSSTTSATTGFASVSSGTNFSPPPLTQTTWYRRVATSGGCTDTTAAVAETVVSSPPGNPAVYGNNVWNVYAYSDNTFTTYAGYYTEPNLSFASSARYTNTQSPSTASGYQGCIVPPTYFSVSMKRTNFTPANYQIDLPGLDDVIILFINGVQVYTRGCCVSASSPVTNIWTGYLGATDQVEIRWTQGAGPSNLAVNFTPVTPSAPLTPGSIQANMAVCYGETVPAGFTSTAAPTSGCTLSGYQWQNSIDSVTWNNIAGATAATYTETAAMTQTTWYRRVALDYCKNTAPTTPVKVTVNVVPPGDTSAFGTSAWIVDLYQYPSSNTNFSAATYKGYYTEPSLSFNSTTRWANGTSPSTASGYQGCYVAPTYHWTVYKRTNFTSGIYQIDIPAHDDWAYLYINGILVFQHIGCCDSHTNVWTGPLGPSDQIEYRVEQMAGGAYSALSLTVVTPSPINSGVTGSNETICAGNVPPQPFTETTAASGGCSQKTYQWQQSTDNGTTWTNISGATAVNFTPTASVYSQTLYRRGVFDVCGLSAYAAPDTVFMNNSAPGDPTQYGNNVWNVYCYQDISFTNYAGYYTEPLLTFNTANRYSTYSPPSMASGYQGCQLINTYYSVSMKRTNIPAGLYQIDIPYHDDDVFLFINGVQVFVHIGCCDSHTNVWTGNIASTDQIEFRWRNYPGPGQLMARFTPVTLTPLSAGTIAANNPNLCPADVPVVNNVTAASGGCYVNYSWQSSTDGGTTWNYISGATGSSYTAASAPAVNIQYRRVAIDVCGDTAYTSAAAFTAGGGAVGDPSVYGNGVWNVYAFEANGAPFSSAIYYGYYTEPLLTFNSLNRWTNAGSPSDASGYQGCQVDHDQHWVSYRRTNFTPGTYQLDITNHDDDVYVFVNGVQVFVHIGCCDSHINIWTGNLGATDQVEFRWRQYYGGTNGGMAFTLVTPSTGVTGNVIAGNQTICSGATPAAFTSIDSAHSGCYLYYQWQSQTNCTGAWTNIVGATGITYAPGALTANTCFRRMATNACGTTQYSDTITVNLYSTTLTAGTVNANQTICSGSTPAALTAGTAPTGGDGNYVYQWQISSDNVGWTNISGATSAGYAPGALTATTYYQRVVTACGATNSAVSPSVTIAVNPVPAITVQPGNASACTGANTSITATATGAGLTYQWQVNTGSGWSNAVNGATYSGVTTNTLGISNVTAGMSGYQYRLVVSGTCTPSVTSNTSTLTTGTAPSIGVQPVSKTVCVGSNTTFAVTASGSGLTYQWQYKTSSGSWTNLVDGGIYSGSLTSALTLTGVTSAYNNYSYQCIIKSSCGGTATTSAAVLTVVARPSNAITASQAICSGMTAATLTGPTGASAYQWQVSTVSATSGFVNGNSPSTNYNYAPNPIGTTSYFRRLASNAGCIDTSTALTVTVASALTISTQPVGQAVCPGATATFGVTASGPGTLTYQWYEYQGSTWAALTDGGNYSGSATATLSVANTTAAMNNWRYYVKVFASGCTTSSVSSNSVALTTSNAPVITYTKPSYTVCTGNSTSMNVTATGLNLTYQWQVNNGAGWANVPNYSGYSGADTYNLTVNPITTAMNGYQFRCIVTGSCTPPATSAVITVTVVPLVGNNAIAAGQTICPGTPTPFTGSVPNGGDGSTYTYQWASNSGSGYTNIAGATSQNYAPGALSQTTYFIRYVTSSNCATNTSNILTLTVTPATSTTDPRDTTTCAGTSTQFAVTGTGTNPAYQWQVNTGSGWSNVSNGAQYTGVTSNTLVVVKPAYAMNGYKYRAVVTGNCAPTSVNSNSATLTVSPVAIITTQPANVQTCAGSTAIFSVAATGSGLLYQWQEKVPSGSWTNITDGGIYGGSSTATLTLTGVTTAMNTNQYQCVITLGSCPATSATASLTVNAQPSLVITNPAPVCAPGTVDLTAAAVTAGSTLAGGTLSYWTNATNIASLSNPSSVSASGTYYIRVATSPVCYDNKPVTVTLNTTLGNNNISAAQTICTGTAPSALTGTTPTGGTGAYTYQWQSSTDGSTFADISGATGTGYTPGTLTATIWYRRVVSSLPCTSTSSSVKITVMPYPTATISYAGSPYCHTGSASVTQTGQAGGTYTAPAAVAINAVTGAIDLTSTTPGTYTITYSFSNGTCNSSTTASITVQPIVTVSISNPAAVCSPGTVNLTAAAVTAGSTSGLTFTYFTDAGATTTLSNPNAVATSGTYYIKGTASNGCFDLKPVTVTINALPTATITYAGSPFCATGTAAVTLTGQTGGVYSSTTGLSIDGTTGAINLAASAIGTYTVTYSFTNGTCANTTTTSVTVNAMPTVTITNPAAVCSPNTVNLTAAAVTAGSSSGLTYTYFTDAAATATLSSPNAVAVSGTYYIKGTNASGCSVVKPVTVTINALPTLTITNPAAVCAPGTVDITAAAVTAGSSSGLTYTYFTDAAATTTLSSPNAVATSGTYYIKGTNASGCSAVKPVTVSINALPTLTITNPAAVCSPTTVDITAAAVTAGSSSGLTLTYFTDAGATTTLSSPNAVAASGTYYIKGTNASGCSVVKPVTVTINALPTLTITNPAAVCSPATVDITAAAVTAGSSSGLTYTYFTDAAATTTLSSPNAVAMSGTYYIKGTNASGCSVVKPVTVTINALPTLTITNPAAVCAPGTVDITAAAVTAGSSSGLTYTYFTNAAATTTLSNPNAVAASGTYYIKGTNASGCSVVKPVAVTINALPTLTITSPAAVCAPGTVDITAAAVTAGSSSGLTYTYFTDAAATTTLSSPNAVATSGTYYIKGTNASGCSVVKPVTVTINALPTLTITNPAAVCAPGTVDITATAVTAGSSSGLTYTYFTDAAAMTTLSSPNAVATSGTYYIKGTNASGCSVVKPVTVTINALPTLTITNPAAVCAPGTVDITAAAVTAGSSSGLTLTYFTDAAATTTLSSPNAVAASGTYYIKGTNASGCSVVKPVTVTINALPTLTITNPAAVCSPSTVDLTAAAVTAGSSSGLTYTYFTDAAATATLSNPNAVATSGTYYIKGTNASGCSVVKPVTVTINALPTLTITNPAAVCAPGTVDLTAAAVTAGSTSGLTYTYFTNAAATTTLSNPNAVAASGTYYIKGTNASGCSVVKPVTVTINALPTLTITNPAAVCSPATVDLTAAAVTAGSSSGLTYTYFTDAAATTTLSSPNAVATSGTYYIKGTNASGCSVVKPVTVTINALPTAAISYAGSPYCATGTATVTQTGQTGGTYSSTTGLSITGSTGAINLAASAAGTYTVTYTFNNGTCPNTTTTTVTVNALPTVTITNPAAVCSPGTVDLTAAAVTAGSSSGLTYTYFTDAAATASLSSPNAVATSGTYYIKGTNANGCFVVKPVTVTVNALPALTITNPAAVCSPSTVDITAAAVTAGSASGLTYTYFTDAAATTTLSSPNAVAVSGTYYIKGTNASGCSVVKTVTVTINALPTATISYAGTPYCATGTASVTQTGQTGGTYSSAAGLSITASTGAINLAVSTAGTYTVTYTFTNGTCSNTATTSVTVNALPALTITNPAAVCTPSTVDITAAAVTAGSSSSLTYTYFTDAAATTTLSNPNAVAASGTYYIKGTNASGCSVVKPVTVTINALPTLTITNPAAVCSPATVDITAAAVTAGSTSGLTYTYFTDAAATTTLSSPNVVAASGTYYIKGTNSSGCSVVKPVTVTINALPTLTITNPAAVCSPSTVDLTAAAVTAGSTSGLTYSYFTDAAATATLSNPNVVAVSGTYYIKGTNASGCSVVKPVAVTINALPVAAISYAGSPYCATGTATVTQTGQTGGTYSSTTGLSINPSTGAINLATSAVGTYTVTYSFTNGTCANTTTTSVTVIMSPSVVITNPAAVCSPATVDLTSSAVTAGSTSGLTYTYFTNAAATTTLSNPNAVAASGTYYIKGSTASGCSSVQPVTVTINALPTVTITNPAAICAPGTVDLTAAAVTSGSSSGLTYTYFTDAAATTTLSNPNAVATSGTYYIKGTNASGCSVVKPVTVTVNALPTLTITNPAAVCSPATVDLTAAAVTAGSDAGLTYTYFTDAAATTTLSSPNAVSTGGTYYIKGTNASGCSVVKPVTVTINALPTVTITNPAAVCSPATVDLTAAAVTAGSSSGLTYTYFTDAAATTTLSSPNAVAASGTYYIKGTNASGCSVVKPVTVTVNALPTLTITNPAAVCSPATVDLTAAAITAGSSSGLTYTYFTDAGATTTLLNPNAVSSSGTYYIKGTNASGCSVVKPVTVTVNALPTVTITNPAAVCSPATVDLTAAAITAGSSSGLTYTYFTDAAATTTLSNPNAVAVSGTYYIKGTNASGCSVVKPVTVTINALPTLTITNPAAVCSPSTVDLTAAAVTVGSSSGLTYTYFTDAAATATLSNPNAVAASGTYYIKGTNASGCSVVKPVTVTINALPTLTISNPAAVCSPATVDLTAAAVTAGSDAGLTYTYFTNAAATTTLSNPNAVATSGTYYIKGTNASGCSVVKPITVTVNALPTLTITNPAAVCSPATVDITAAAVTAGSSSGLTYTYFTDAAATTTLSNPNAVATSGTYYIKGTNASGCSVVKPVSVTINALPTATISYAGSPYCGTGTASVTRIGQAGGVYSSTTGLSIDPSTGAINLSASSAGTYTVTYSFTNGTCPNTATASVTVNGLPTAAISYAGSPYCATGTASATQTGLSGGVYSSTTGLSLDASTGAINLAASSAGTYTVTYSFTNGTCSTTATTTVTINALPTVTITNPAAVCSPATVDITAAAVTTGSTSGLTYTYFTDAAATTTLSNPNAVATSGTYYIKGTNASGCSVVKPVTVTINALPTVTITNPAAICAPGTADLTAAAITAGSDAGLTYTYFTNAAATTALSSPNAVAVSGTYYIKGTNASGCSVVKPVTVTINALPTVTITNPAAVCSPATVDITAAAVTAGSTSGLTYTYFTDAAATTTLSSPNAVATSGTYYIKGTNASGCSVVKPVTVTVNALPTLTIINPAAVCAPGTVDITAAAVTAGSSSGLTYTYFTDAAATTTLSSPNAVAASGTYYIKGTNASGCSVVKPVTVTINALPTLTITNPAAVCSPGTADLTAAAVTAGSSSGLTYTYFTDAAATTTLSSPNAVAASGTYYIKGTNASGCSVVKPVTVTINALPTLTISNPAAVCSPATVDLTATAVTAGSSSGLTYTYFTDAAAATTLSNPNAVATSGTYYIKGTNASGCSVVKPVTVTINALPAATIAYSGTPYCATGTATVTQTGQAGGTYSSTTGLSISSSTGAINLTASTAGTYTVTYSFTNGTCPNTTTTSVTVNAMPTVTIVNPAAVCAPGTIDLTAAAVTAGSDAGLTYTYFTDAAATTTLSNPNAVSTSGTYYIKGTNVNGCSVVKPVTVTINALPTAAISYAGSPYCGTGTGNVTQTGQPGGTYSSTAGLSIDASTGAINLAASTAGTYTVTYSFTNGTCPNTATTSVTINGLPTATISYAGTPYCATGTASVTQTGQTGGTYSSTTGLSIDASTGAIDLAASTTGTYTVTYAFTNGTCSTTATTTVTVNAMPTVTITNPAAVCAPGTIDLTAAAVTAGSSSGLTYTYFTDAAATATLSNPNAVSASGTYYIKGTNASGCSVVKPVTATINALPTVTITNPAAVCAPGTIDLTAAAVTAGSDAGLTYTYFTDAAATTTLSNPNAVSTSGTYYIKGTNASGCSVVEPVTATINALPTVTITNPAAVCAPGTIDLTAAAVTAGSSSGLTYTYFTNAAATTTLSNPNAVAASGTYYIKGTNASGCSVVKPVTATINALPTVTITNPAAVCAPGTIDLTAAAVTAGSDAGLTYTYFTDAAATTTLSNPNAVAASGTYYIKGTNANGCSVVEPVTVIVNALPTATISYTGTPYCATGTASVTQTGQTGGTYSSTTGLSIDASTGAIDLAASTAGTYTVTYAFTNGTCSTTATTTVTVNAMPAVTITNPAAICAPGTIDLTAAAITAGSSSGLTYTYFTDAAATTTLSNPNAVATSGTYYIKGTNASGCSVVKPVTVTINALPTVTITNPAAVCAPGTIDLTAAAVTAGSDAGLTYTYFTDAAATTTLSNPNAVAASGTYYIKGTNANGCSVVEPVTVTVNALPTATISYAGTPYCATGTASVTQTGQTGGTYSATTGLSIDASTGAIDLAGSTVGTYTVTYSFTNGTCANTTTTSVTINALPTATISYAGTPYCATGTAGVTQTGQAGGTYSSTTGLSIDASTGTINLATSTAGTYTVTYSFTNGTCSNTTTTSVTVSALPHLVINNPPAICAPGKVDLTAAAVTAGSDAGLTLSYFKDASATTTLPNPTAVAASGLYYIKAVNASGCVTVKSVGVIINPLPSATISYPGTSYCTHGTALVTQTGQTGGTYSASPSGLAIDATTGTLDLSSSDEGVYAVTYSFTNGTCPNTTMTTVKVINPILVTQNPAAVCYPNTVDLTAAAVTAGSADGLAFDYYTDAAGTSVLTAPGAVAVSGTYYIRGYTPSGCMSSIQPVQVTVNTKPSVSAAASNDNICLGSTITLTALSPGNTIWWIGQPAGNPITVTPQDTTTYYAVAQTADGCTDTAAVPVNATKFKVVLSGAPNPVVAGFDVTLTTTANFTYSVLAWSPDEFFTDQTALSQTIMVKDTSKTFAVIAKSDDGCLDTAMLKIEVEDNLGDFFIPNAFTPNGDGTNDVFRVFGSSVKEVHMRVFNQWGQLIYEGSDAQSGWDGNFNGKPQPVGPYLYVIKTVFYNNRTVIRRGSVNLMR